MRPPSPEAVATLAPARDLPAGWETVFLLGLVSAVLGAFVAWLAYRGYARNDSRPMLFLSVGVACLTTVQFLVTYGSLLATSLTDAQILLLFTACQLVGLLAIYRSLRRPSRSR